MICPEIQYRGVNPSKEQKAYFSALADKDTRSWEIRVVESGKERLGEKYTIVTLFYGWFLRKTEVYVLGTKDGLSLVGESITSTKVPCFCYFNGFDTSLFLPMFLYSKEVL